MIEEKDSKFSDPHIITDPLHERLGESLRGIYRLTDKVDMLLGNIKIHERQLDEIKARTDTVAIGLIWALIIMISSCLYWLFK